MRFRFALLLVLLASLLALAGCGGGSPHHAGRSPHRPGFATQAPPLSFGASAPQPTLEMFDTITLGTVPGNPAAVAGYTAGFWPTYGPLLRAFPRLAAIHRVISIAIGWGYRATCLDDEPGDATPSEVVPWVRAEIAIGNTRPCVYASVSQMFSSINSLLAAAGLSNHVRRWCAWYRYFAGLISGCDAVQWNDHAYNRNLDESTVALSFFGALPKRPPPPDPYHYRLFQTGPFPSRWGRLYERQLVEWYDGLRRHPARNSHLLHKWVEPELLFLANRIYALVHENHICISVSTCRPVDWNRFARGFRQEQLRLRSGGARVAK